jgi:proteasome-associated ATPase
MPNPSGGGYYGSGPYAQRATFVQSAGPPREEAPPRPPEPRTLATVVELITNDRMLVTIGPIAPMEVAQLPEVRVGDRVFLDRQSMQPEQILRDEIPVGSIVSVLRVHKSLIEATFLEQLKTFRSTAFPKLKVGERVVIDPSMSFVIGTMGMPPQKHARPPAISVSWDDIGGQDEAKDALREAIELPFAHPALFKHYGMKMSKGALLFGPPGTGKTLVAKAAATSLARAHGKDATEGFVYVKGPELLNSYIGKSEEAVRGLFASAREHKAKHGYPALIFVDECDALLGSRDRSPHTSLNATIVPQFLAEMDGLDDHAAMFILATNRPDMLDPAVVRDGRIDRRVRIGRPTPDDAAAIFRIHLRGRPIVGDLEQVIQRGIAEIYADRRRVRELGDVSAAVPLEPVRLRDLASGALIAGVVDRAAQAAMRRDIAAGAARPTGIAEADIADAIDRAQSALRDADVLEAIRELDEAARGRQNTSATPAASADP